jgi:hypothetical protein
MLLLMHRLPYFRYLASGISDLKSLAESVFRQLRAWADSLEVLAVVMHGAFPCVCVRPSGCAGEPAT